MPQDLRAQPDKHERWLRGLYMLLYAVIYNVVEILIVLIAVYQFVSTVFTGHQNGRLLALGASLSRYVYDIMAFLTYTSEHKPFPFSEWGSGGPAA